jgi:hypothetical protein
VDEIAGFEAFGGEEAPAGAFNLGFSDLDVHFSLLFCLVDSIVDQMKLMSIDDILGVAGSERVKTFVGGASVHFCTLHTHRKLPSFSQHIKGVPVAILLFRMSYKALYGLVRVTHVRVHVRTCTGNCCERRYLGYRVWYIRSAM